MDVVNSNKKNNNNVHRLYYMSTKHYYQLTEISHNVNTGLGFTKQLGQRSQKKA